jgi:hypothetical protein
MNSSRHDNWSADPHVRLDPQSANGRKEMSALRMGSWTRKLLTAHLKARLFSGVLQLALGLHLVGSTAWGLGYEPLVTEEPGDGHFCLFAEGQAAGVWVDTNDYAGVVRAAHAFRTDINRVSGLLPPLVQDPSGWETSAIIIGTIGKSSLVDQLIRARKLNADPIAGRWESSLIQIVEQPLPGVEKALVIAGSDQRGTIYGVYNLSEQIGVSPWYWWADVPPKRSTALYVMPKTYTQGPPAVKYRGIFINDEEPALGSWAREKAGGINSKMYAHVFELILRLRGNFLWPAMWGKSIYEDDPESVRLADEYGIVLGTSHHEPLTRAHVDWSRNTNHHGNGQWNYATNEEALKRFWTEGIRRNKDYETLITVGMRGDGDEPMSETESVELLERIVDDQREIIGEVLDTNITEVPQVWALYKEVQGYYERGMRVPDDVTLLWCDDNWGNIRRLPTAEERKRRGGAGIYYHFDYVGGPRNYKWLNVTPLPKVWEQMNLAYHYGADRLWIVNVGDLKPMEVPIEFFLTLAWNPEAWSQHDLDDYLRRWAEREFGREHAADIADIVAKYAKYNRRRTPELLEPGTFSIENYGEADRVLADWKAISDQAAAIYATLPGEAQDAFYQLVLHPVKASATLNELYDAVARNRFYAAHGDGRANEFAERARQLFAQDAQLSDYYNHELAGGKWNHMMDQTHIGYTSWQQPESNAMPETIESTNAIALIDALAPPATTSAPAVAWPAGWEGFVEGNGYVSMEAEHYTRKTESSAARWEVLPDHGRTLSAMTIFPVTAASVPPPQDSPCLEYAIYLFTADPVEVTLLLSPSLNFAPDRGVQLAVSFDEDPPQVLTVVPRGYAAGEGNPDWEASVRNSIRALKSTHTPAGPGAHTLKVWMVDPGVVLQKVIVNTGGLLPSYLGPPESVVATNVMRPARSPLQKAP